LTDPFQVMGIVNVTPDSFSDGGSFLDADSAIAHALTLVAEGAQIIDIGGESTRPGAEPVPEAVEQQRVLPVIEGLRAAGCEAELSIDTSKAAVASAALAAGATFVNDVTALRGDPSMAAVVAGSGARCCLMHMLGEPRTMQRDPCYAEVVADVRSFLRSRMQFAIDHGIAEDRILLDPGIGFGKTVTHNLELLRRLDEITQLGPPVVIGTSRKSFLGAIGGDHEAGDRLAGTIATNVIAYERGASVFRVHDVAAIVDALRVAAATVPAPWRKTTTSSTTPTT
jgi:dihydropteroate synthase